MLNIHIQELNPGQPMNTFKDLGDPVSTCTPDDRMTQDNRYKPTDMALETNPLDRPRRRGPTKTPATIRFDTEVLSALKATGPGWQTRVNQIVRQWVLKDRSPGDE